ncbi:hypothetical protein [Massilia sp. PWRC2]|uniref:hypothetical protein n=1 Tax=Massilia sp. PWRC2 TaxID=2804626 RepID=UPI003CEE354F
MTTVATIIELALKDLGIVGEGQTASGQTLDDALTTLGQMLAMWQADGLYVYAQKVISVPLTGLASYSIGEGGAVNVQRPNKIDSATLVMDQSIYPVECVNSLTDYERMRRDNGATPRAIYYLPSYPLGSVQPIPASMVGELRMVTRIDLPEYAGATDDIGFPPEYALALRYSLCEHLSATFGTPLRTDIPALAGRSRKIIKRNNVRIPKSQMPDAVMRNGYYQGRR